MADVTTTLHPEGAPEDNLYPNVKRENIPDYVLFGDQLWLNSDPLNPFSETTVNLSNGLSHYTEVAIAFKYYSGSNNSTQIQRAKTGTGRFIFLTLANLSGKEIASRIAEIISDTQIKFSSGAVLTDGVYTTQNWNFCVPIAVYGIK